MSRAPTLSSVFFFTATATTEIYTLSLHDALPIYFRAACRGVRPGPRATPRSVARYGSRSEEHTSELQSHHDLVCRLLLEKKKKYHVEPFRARDAATVSTSYSPG